MSHIDNRGEFCMRDLIWLIDRAKSLNPNDSDYYTAKYLGIDPRSISSWRAGRRLPTQEQVFGMAKLADENPDYWVFYLEAEKARDDKMAEYWRDAAERLAS